MKNCGGLYPRVQVDAAGAGVVSQAGAVVLVETARATGLDRQLSQALHRWRRPNARHDPGKVVLDLAINLAVGGDSLADVAVLRGEPRVFGPVASDPTVSRTIAALAGDAPRALSAIRGARATARRRAWDLAGEHAPDHDRSAIAPLVIDLDATLVTAHSDKENARPTYKHGYGFHPLTAFLDHGSDGTGEPLAIQLRPGNAGSNTAVDHIEVTCQALRQLPGHRVGTRAGRKVFIRTDGAGYSHAFLTWLTGQRLSYSIGFGLPDDIAYRLPVIPDEVWAPAYDADGQVRPGAWVAEVTGLLDLRSWPPGMRVVLRKERPHPGAQLRLTVPRKRGCPQSTATGSPPSPPTPRGPVRALSWPTSSCVTGAGRVARPGSATPRTPASRTSPCTGSPRTRCGARSSPSPPTSPSGCTDPADQTAH